MFKNINVSRAKEAFVHVVKEEILNCYISLLSVFAQEEMLFKKIIYSEFRFYLYAILLSANKA